MTQPTICKYNDQQTTALLKPPQELGLQIKKNRTDDWSKLLLAIGEHQDRQAFVEFFEHFAPMIKGYFIGKSSLSLSPNMVDELIQEVMLKIWRKAAQFNPEKSAASTWLFTMARNTHIDMLRRQSKHQSETLETEDVWATEEHESPVAQLQQQRDKNLIHQSIQALPNDQATIVKKIYLEGKTHTLVAEELQIPLGTVKSRLRLALAKMKILVGHNANGTED